MFHAKFKTAMEMYESLVTRYMFDDPELKTTTHFDRTYTQPVVLEISDPTPDINLGTLAWGESRWEKFCRQYLNEQIIDWADSCLNLPITGERGYAFETKANHENGNCVVYMTFRNNPVPSITLFSRAAHLVPTSALELSLINIMADRLRPYFDQPVSLIWMAAQIQFSTMWAFPYLVHEWYPRHQDDPRILENNLSMRGWRNMIKRYNAYVDEGVIPPYGRTANMFKRLQTVNDPYIPTKIFINGEWL